MAYRCKGYETRGENEKWYIEGRERLGKNTDTTYTHSSGHVQTEVSRSGRNKKLSEGMARVGRAEYIQSMSDSGCHRRQDDGLVGPMYLTFSNMR